MALLNEADTLRSANICFLGAGSMAEAIVRGLISRAQADPKRITMINRRNQERLRELNGRHGIHTALDEPSKAAALQSADLIVLGMKPKDAATALRELRSIVREQQLIVSVVAGLSIPTIERLLGRTLPIARTMPNTSSTIGQGATGISFSAACSEQAQRQVLTMFQSIGMTSIVPEPLLDTVTGISGSGPAYLYYVMDAMIEAGMLGGLSLENARELTIQTVLGAAMMVRETKESPAELRRKVTSPNGTTQAAIETLDAHHCREAIIQAVTRATLRAGELGQEIERSVELSPPDDAR